MADIVLVRHRRPRQFRRIHSQLTDLSDEELRQRYRFSRNNLDRLVRLLGPALGHKANPFNHLNIICTGKFTSINACWPGSCHDSHILRASNLGMHLEANHQDPERGYLLGDSGYPCRPFLLTPFLMPGNEKEERYNRAHISTRNVIERSFGVWKRTFHILHGEIRMKPRKVTRVIVACAVLHNLKIQWGEPQCEGDGDVDQPPSDLFQGATDGRGVRDRVSNAYF